MLSSEYAVCCVCASWSPREGEDFKGVYGKLLGMVGVDDWLVVMSVRLVRLFVIFDGKRGSLNHSAKDFCVFL